MHYATRADLPADVRALPLFAQQVYLETFNRAWPEHAAIDQDPADAALIAQVHTIAWDAAQADLARRPDDHDRVTPENRRDAATQEYGRSENSTAPDV